MRRSRVGDRRGFGPSWKIPIILVSIGNKLLEPYNPLGKVGPPSLTPALEKVFKAFFRQMDLGKQLREAGGLNFGLSLHLYLMYASRKGSGKSAHISRLDGIAH